MKVDKLLSCHLKVRKESIHGYPKFPRIGHVMVDFLKERERERERRLHNDTPIQY